MSYEIRGFVGFCERTPRKEILVLRRRNAHFTAIQRDKALT